MVSNAIEHAVLQAFRSVPINGPAFHQRLKRCDLAACKGMCCYDGVYIDRLTEAALHELVNARKPEFQKMGIELPDSVIVDGDWPGLTSERKTAVRRFGFSAVVASFPGHFNNTSCVFRTNDGRCGLQVLASDNREDAWQYKPVNCWLFPIWIGTDQITLHNAATDPTDVADYPGFSSHTQCGTIEHNGDPAFVVLERELLRLGAILGRDLIDEIKRSPPPSP